MASSIPKGVVTNCGIDRLQKGSQRVTHRYSYQICLCFGILL